MSLTFDIGARSRCVEVNFSTGWTIFGDPSGTPPGKSILFKAQLDGVDMAPGPIADGNDMISPNVSRNVAFAYDWWTCNVPGGVHTAKIQWAVVTAGTKGVGLSREMVVEDRR